MTARIPHRLAVELRRFRNERGWSLLAAQAHTGVDMVVIGSYERGDRQPPMGRLDALAGHYGMQLAFVPKGTDMASLLADREELHALRRMIGDAMSVARAASEVEPVNDLTDDSADDGELFAVPEAA